MKQSIQKMLPRMMILALLGITSACAASPDAADQAADHQQLAREIAGFAYPEAVFQAGNVLYVSNMNTPGDGFISKVDWRSGSITALRFLPRSGGLRNPMGMVVMGNTLYVADSPNIVGFDLASGAKVLDLEIPNSGRLNDIVLAPGACGAKPCFFVSDDAAGRILKVIPQDASHSVYASNVRGVNGMAFDPRTRTIYVAGLSETTTASQYHGALYKVTPNPVRVTKLVDTGTFPDGIALSHGRLYFSDWGDTLSNGYIASVALTHPTQVQMETAVRTINGPADFAMGHGSNYLFIPALVENKVIVQPLDLDEPACGNSFEAWPQ
jgi:DNA-binding beta-propeller fold protein YncE